MEVETHSESTELLRTITLKGFWEAAGPQLGEMRRNKGSEKKFLTS